MNGSNVGQLYVIYFDRHELRDALDFVRQCARINDDKATPACTTGVDCEEFAELITEVDGVRLVRQTTTVRKHLLCGHATTAKAQIQLGRPGQTLSAWGMRTPDLSPQDKVWSGPVWSW